MPVLHGAVSQVAEVRPGAAGLAEQQGLALTAGAVGWIEEQQTAEFPLGPLFLLAGSPAESLTATGRWWIVVTPAEPLQGAVGGPGPQPGAIGREVLGTQQRLGFRCGQQQFEEPGYPFFAEQPVTVSGERRGIPDGIIRVEAEKPAEQQVVIQLFDQHPLRANAVDRLQQEGQQKLLRRDRGVTSLGIERD